MVFQSAGALDPDRVDGDHDAALFDAGEMTPRNLPATLYRSKAR